ncbi:MAG: flagellin [Pseudomonadota bacterium]
MALRINTNIAALNAHRQLIGTDNALSVSIQRLSSGYRINQAKDDVAGLAIANKFRGEIRGLRMAQQNASQSNSYLQVAEGGANQIEAILERMVELATSAASDNTDSTGRAQLDAEAQKLIEEIGRISNDTKYSATTLIDGSGGTLTFQIGSANTVDDQITVALTGVNFTGAGLNVENDTDVDLTTKANAQKAITQVNAAISASSTGLGTLGAAQSRISFASANLATSIENMVASESTIRDADMAYEMVAFTRNQIMLQAGTAMLAQANMAPQVVLTLLG